MHTSFKSLCYFCVVEKLMTYIEKVLAANDHVVVPGLGAFVVQQQSARISGDEILPPSSTIGFNPLIISSDGMLAIEVSRSLRITYRQASAMINKEVTDFLTNLEGSREMQFGHSGTFHRDENGHLIFTPAAIPAFIPANLGLSVITTGTSTKKIVRDMRLTRMTNQWIQYAAVFLVLLSLIFPAAVNENHQVSRADLSMLKAVQTVDTVETPAAEVVDIAEAEAEVETVADDAAPQTEYKVVVAVYDLEEKALQFCSSLQAADYPEAEVLTGNHGSKVIIKTFNDLLTAVNFMEKLRKTDARFADAWVMKK